jgi:L-seryl-tRNA(Ser) seleniumtransferase
MPGIYQRLGVRPLLNARGTHTRLGGSLMAPEVLDAMREAASAFVVLEELQAVASALISRATGAEAGLVTSGAAAGLLLGTAACMTGTDHASIDRLPRAEGMPKNRAVMHRAHRNGYDHSVRAAGAVIVEVGYAHRTMPYQLEAALEDDQVAVVVYLMSPWASRGALSLVETCRIAHRYDVPVLVDGAATLPPADNLRRFVADGADLVVFSGGKGINGPQASGVLAGRADLIQAAALNGSPNHGVGRAAKAAKEDIVGLIVALERYLHRDHAADVARWQSQTEHVANALRGLPGVETRCRHDSTEYLLPQLEIAFDASLGVDVHSLVQALEEGDPRLFVLEPTGPSATPNSMIVNPHPLQAGEERIVAEVLGAALRKYSSQPVGPLTVH